MKKVFAAAIIALLPALAVSQTATNDAKSAPKGSMTVVNPFTVGGLTDLVARMVAEKSHSSFPDGVVVVSKPGAGGSIGITSVIHSKPDGTHIGFSPSGAIVVPPQMMTNLQYKNPDDIEPIINVFSSYQLLAVRADSKWKTAEQFIEDVRKEPGKYTLGYTGQGSASHLNMAQLIQAADLKVVEVPYQGWAQSSPALLGGHVDAVIVNAGEGRALVDGGRIRMLGVFLSDRVPYHPDVPSFKELGYDIGVRLNFFFFGPKNMDPAVKQYIHDAFRRTLEDKEFKDFIASREVTVDYMDGAATKDMLWSEYKLHTKLLGELGLLAQ